jgi:hypothetical protein
MSKLTSKSIPLLSYINDAEGGPFELKGYYEFNGGSPINLPGGIFSWETPDTLKVESTQAEDVGYYDITLTISDS